MECKFKKYSVDAKKLPHLEEEADALNALIIDKLPILEDAIEDGEFFQLSEKSLDFTFDVNRLDTKIKQWLTKEILDEFIIGISFTSNGITFNGYIEEESIDIDKKTRDYLITAIDWWKYFYDVAGGEPTPYSNTLTGKGQIEFFLRLSFLCDLITEVEVNIDDTPHGVRPYINMEHYQKYAPLMTIKDVVDTYHKKLVGVFKIRGTKLIFNQYHKTFGAQKNITDLVLNKDEVTDRVVNYTKYDAVAVNDYGCNFMRRMINGKLISTGVDNELKPSDPRWEILDLREKIKGASLANSFLSDIKLISYTKIKVLNSTIDEDGEYMDYPPSLDWIDKAILITNIFEAAPHINAMNRWRGRIIDVNGDELTISWLGKFDGELSNKPLLNTTLGARIADIIEEDAVYLEDVSPSHPLVDIKVFAVIDRSLISNIPESGMTYNKSGKIINIPVDGINAPYLDKNILYKVFNPKKSFLRTLNTIDINTLDEVVLHDEVLKVIRADKDIYNKITQVELEETGKDFYPPQFE